MLRLIFFTAPIDISDFVYIFASLNHYGGLENKKAGVAQLVERDLAKVEAAGSNPVSRSRKARQKTL